MRVVTVVAGLIVDRSRILITRRAPNESFSGGWEFPGGKIEKDENHTECLKRELKEELDISIEIDRFCCEIKHDYRLFTLHMFTYYCTIQAGSISLSVHDAYQWVEIPDLLKFDLLPADVPVAEKVLEEYVKNE